MRVEKPKREGEATLLYPFDAQVAWVAACYHRRSSRISWDLCSSDAVRLEPLFADLLPALSPDDRLPEAERVGGEFLKSRGDGRLIKCTTVLLPPVRSKL